MALTDFFNFGRLTELGRTVNQAVGRNLVNENTYQYFGNGQPILNQDNFDYVADGYVTVGAVYECVDLIMKKLIASPPLIYRVKDATKLKQYENLSKSSSAADRARATLIKAESLEEVDEPKIRALLEQPNEKQTWDEFLSLIAGLYLVTGNSLVYGNAGDKRSRKWSEIWALPFAPKDISIISGGVFDPVKEYGVSYNSGESKLNFPADQIEHIKTVNLQWDTTGRQLFGMSPLRPYVRQLLRDRVGNDQANKILNNGGTFGIVSPKNKEDQWQADQRKQFRETLIDSARNAHDELTRIFPSSVPLDWLQIGLSSADMEILALTKATREDIYRAYHVPATFASNDASTYNNMVTANKQLIYNAVAPVAEVISKALTDFICIAYDKKYIIKLDYMSLPELSADNKETAEWLSKCTWLNQNEKREAMGWGKDETTPGMNSYFMPKGLARIEDVVEGKTLTSSSTNNENNDEGK